MRAGFLRLLLLGCVVGCDDTSGAAPADGAVADGYVQDRPTAVDARVALDARVADVGGRDARVMDAEIDAGLADAVATEGPILDAARAHAGRADSGPLEPDACVGVDPPPAPPASPDGSEVCNYVDDDGDGLVDEGFEYEFISPPVFLGPAEDTGDLRLAVDAGHRAAVWYRVAIGEANVVVLYFNERLCPGREPITFAHDPTIVRLMTIKAVSGIVAIASNRFGNDDAHDYLQLVGPEGLHGEEILLNPEGVDSLHGLFSLSAFGDSLLVYSVGRQFGWATVLSPPLWQLGEWTPVADGSGTESVSEVAFDGEGFGMVYNWFAEPSGLRTARFERWTLEGEQLTRPVAFASGNIPGGRPIEWDGRYFRFSVTTTFANEALYFVKLDQAGEQAPGSPFLLTQHFMGPIRIDSSFSLGMQQFHAGNLRRGPLIIRSSEGQVLQTAIVPSPNAVALAADEAEGRPPRLIAFYQTSGGGEGSIPTLRYFGCPLVAEAEN